MVQTHTQNITCCFSPSNNGYANAPLHIIGTLCVSWNYMLGHLLENGTANIHRGIILMTFVVRRSGNPNVYLICVFMPLTLGDCSVQFVQWLYGLGIWKGKL
jgi:hypothetical protein